MAIYLKGNDPIQRDYFGGSATCHEDFFTNFPRQVHLVWDLGPDESVSQSSVSAAQQMHLGCVEELEGDGVLMVEILSP